MAENAADNDFGQGIPVPTWLETPATSTVRPPVETRCQELPFEQLSWEDFERLCLRLARREADVEHCQLYGVRGQSQGGIDLYARRAGSSKYTVYQCRRVESFGPKDIADAVDDFFAGAWRERSDRFVLCVRASLVPTQRADELERQRERLAGRGVELTGWDAHQLSEKLKSIPELVDDFFGREWTRCFLGNEQAQNLQDRLDGGEVQRLRDELHAFYQRVFSLHDPGLQVSDRPGERTLAVDEWFVMPDVTEVPAVGETALVRSTRRPSAAPPDIEADSGELGGPQTSAGERELVPELDYKQRQDVDRWLALHDRVFVIGGPGSGKSSLLRFVALDLLKQEPALREIAGRWGQYLPLWVPFPRWTRLISQPATSSASLEDILQDWFKSWNATEFWPLVRKALRDERLLLLVDGLDEWASEEAAGIAIDRLQAFAIAGRPVPTIIASRPHGFQRLRPSTSGWAVGQLAGFTLAQQRELAAKWFAHRERMVDDQSSPEQIEQRAAQDANGLMNDLRSSTDLHELAAVPFLLTLLIYFRFSEAGLPTTRFQAYRLMLEHLIEKHPQRRRRAASVPETRQELSTQDVHKALAHLAYQIHLAQPEGQVTANQARDWIRDLLADPDGEFGFRLVEARGLADALVMQACDSIGLLVRHSQDTVGFFHRAFQEFLAAEHLASLPWTSQREQVETSCVDPTWREVILALLHLTRIPSNVDTLLERMEARAAGPAGRVVAELILAEAAFGDCGCRATLARRLAERALAKVEEPGWMPLRVRLLDCTIPGLQSSRVSELIRERMRRWYPCRDKWRERTYQAMSEWPRSPELLRCLFAGLSDEEDYNRRGAAAALVTHARQDAEIVARLVSHIKSTASIEAQAAALFALIEACPQHPELLSLADRLRHSADPDLRSLTLLAIVRQGRAGLAERDALLARDEQDSIWSTWAGCRLAAILEGWPRSPEVKAACLDALSERWGQRLDAATAWELLLRGYPQDDEVAKRCAEELEHKKHPFIALHDHAWPLVRENFANHPLLVQAVDKWLGREQHDPIAIHHASLVGRTDVARQKLLDHVLKPWPWWAANALVQGWPDDPEVMKTLRATASGPAGPASGTAESIPRILSDHTQAAQRLLSILRDPECTRPDLVMRGLHQLPAGYRPVEVEDVVISRLPEWRHRGRVLSELFIAYAGRARVRALALDELERCSANVYAIAVGFKDDSEIRQRIIDRSVTLPKPLRHRLVIRLGQLSYTSDDARRFLKCFDDEHEQEVKAQACIEYCRLLGDAHENVDEQLEVLNQMALSRGIEHMERRLAAFCGFTTLHRLNQLAQLRESFGNKPPQFPRVHRGLGENLPFVHCLLDHWEEAKSILDPHFTDVAFGTFGPGLYGWDIICKVADAYPAAARDAIAFLESVDLQTAQRENLRENTLRFLARIRPKSELLRRYCLWTLPLTGGTYGGWVTGTLAADLLAEQFGGDQATLDALLGDRSRDRLPVGVILALAEGWPRSEFFLTHSAEWIQRLRGAEAFRLACRASSSAQAHDRLIALLGDRRAWNPYLAQGLLQPLIRRVRDDDAFRDLLARQLADNASPTEVASIVRVLAAAGRLSDATRAWCDGVIAAQQDPNVFADCAFDLLAGAIRPLSDCLLDAISPLT